jgi:hypothetical protein
MRAQIHSNTRTLEDAQGSSTRLHKRAGTLEVEAFVSNCPTFLQILHENETLAKQFARPGMPESAIITMQCAGAHCMAANLTLILQGGRRATYGNIFSANPMR